MMGYIALVIFAFIFMMLGAFLAINWLLCEFFNGIFKTDRKWWKL